jgi:hypothetical protein
MVFEICLKSSNKFVWHRSNSLIINYLDISEQFYCLISIFLSLFCQVKSLGKFLSILIFELNRKSADKF